MRTLFAIVGVVATLFFAVCAGTLMGGIVGWTVNLAFPVVHDSLNAITKLNLDAFDQGAVLGFVSGFLRANISVEKT